MTLYGLSGGRLAESFEHVQNSPPDKPDDYRTSPDDYRTSPDDRQTNRTKTRREPDTYGTRTVLVWFLSVTGLLCRTITHKKLK